MASEPNQTKEPTTTQVHDQFIREPMGEKTVYELAGIGRALGGKLNTNDFYRADQVFGQFLVFNRDKTLFKNWLHGLCDANVKQQNECYQCLYEWANQYW